MLNTKDNARSKQLAKNLSELLPTYLMHMIPYVFKSIDMSMSQLIVLLTIEEKRICTLGEVSKEMRVSAPTMTGLIDRLERDGFVKRMPDKKDRRITRVELTSQGRAITVKFRNNIMKRWVHILTKTPSKLGETIVDAIKTLNRGLQDGTI